MSRESACDVQRQGWRNGGIKKTENRRREGEWEGGGKTRWRQEFGNTARVEKQVGGRQGNVTNVSLSGTVWQ